MDCTQGSMQATNALEKIPLLSCHGSEKAFKKKNQGIRANHSSVILFRSSADSDKASKKSLKKASAFKKANKSFKEASKSFEGKIRRTWSNVKVDMTIGLFYMNS